MTIAVEDIQEEFADLDLDITDGDVLVKLQELCQQYGIDANKISCEYFSYNTKSKLNTGKAPTLETLLNFENDKLKTMKREGVRRPLDPIEGVDNLPDCAEVGTPARLGAVSKRNVTPDSQNTKRFVSAIGSPSVTASFSPSVTSSQQGQQRYAERKNRGEVVLKHNPDLAGDWTPSLGGGSGPLKVDTNLNSNLTESYRYMFERMRDRAGILDETICRVEDLLVAQCNLGGEPIDTRVTEVETRVAVGRICCDSDGRLNSNSVVLQGSMDACNGHTIPVDVSRLESYSLFPGQIVAIEGTIPNGSSLLATRVYTDVPPGPAEAVAEDQVLDVVSVAGPYLTSDSDSLQPLQDICKYIRDSKPHVAIMIGPFVDVRNTCIENGSESYEQVFSRILGEIATITEDSSTEVVLVPSQRDAQAHYVYPQPPFNIGPEFSGKIRCVSDPAVLNLNGIIVGLTSSDILFHLGKEEIRFPTRTGDRLSRLSSHLLSQRSFYPLYPPSEDQNIDYKQLEVHAQLNLTPHLLLLPSDLIHFARDLEEASAGCTVVNPGRLTKGPGPGTFGRVLIRSQGGKVECKAEVIRI